MNRKTSFVPESYYHIFNRGTEKRNIFLNENDYRRFLVLLYLCNSNNSIQMRDYFRQGRTLAEVWRDILNTNRGNLLISTGAYCLMPNHFHLLIKEKTDNGISSFMKKLCTAYAMYFNKKNERSGNLFQGKFGAELLNDDRYLKYIFAYIHLNPIKLIEPDWKEKGIKDINRAKEFLNNYQWFSYDYYRGQKQKDPILNEEEFPEYFRNYKEFKDFIEDWLNFQGH